MLDVLMLLFEEFPYHSVCHSCTTWEMSGSIVFFLDIFNLGAMEFMVCVSNSQQKATSRSNPQQKAMSRSNSQQKAMSRMGGEGSDIINH